MEFFRGLNFGLGFSIALLLVLYSFETVGRWIGERIKSVKQKQDLFEHDPRENDTGE